MQPISLKYAGVACNMLLLLCLSATNLYAQKKEVIHRDNHLVLMEHPKDTTDVVNPLTGEEAQVITRRSDDVLSLNKEKVHKCTPEEAEATVTLLSNAVEEKTKNVAKQLSKGTYNYYAETVVINKQGKVVYLEPGYVYREKVVDIDGKEVKNPEIPASVQTQLRDYITEIIEYTDVPPIKKEGEVVNAVVHVNGSFVVE